MYMDIGFFCLPMKWGRYNAPQPKFLEILSKSENRRYLRSKPIYRKVHRQVCGQLNQEASLFGVLAFVAQQAKLTPTTPSSHMTTSLCSGCPTSDPVFC